MHWYKQILFESQPGDTFRKPTGNWPEIYWTCRQCKYHGRRYVQHLFDVSPSVKRQASSETEIQGENLTLGESSKNTTEKLTNSF